MRYNTFCPAELSFTKSLTSKAFEASCHLSHPASQKKWRRSSIIRRPPVVDATRLTGWVKPGEIWQWISEFEFCNHTKILTPLHPFYAEKIFISCVWLIPVSRVSTPSSPFDTDILQPILLDLKFSTRSVPVDISN